jgi:hypothetical protein
MNMEFIGASLGYHRNNEVKISSSMRANRYHFFDAAAKHPHLNFSYPSLEVIPEKKFRKMQ